MIMPKLDQLQQFNDQIKRVDGLLIRSSSTLLSVFYFSVYDKNNNNRHNHNNGTD